MAEDPVLRIYMGRFGLIKNYYVARKYLYVTKVLDSHRNAHGEYRIWK